MTRELTHKSLIRLTLSTGLLGICCMLSACSDAAIGTRPGIAASGREFAPPSVVGFLNPKEIVESSGIAASKCSEGVLWTHNDSGDGNVVFAIDSKGTLLGKWEVSGADNVDWEDIATHKDRSGKCFIYIGDIGGNAVSRSFQTIYRISEPPSANTEGKKARTEPAQRIDFTYQEKVRDAETLLINPENGSIYVISKTLVGNATLFEIPKDFQVQEKVSALKVADLSPGVLGGIITGGDISPDGRFVLVCDYFNGYEFAIPESGDIKSAFEQKPSVIDLGERRQGESICYSKDGGSIFATSEKANSPLIRVDIKR